MPRPGEAAGRARIGRGFTDELDARLTRWWSTRAGRLRGDLERHRRRFRATSPAGRVASALEPLLRSPAPAPAIDDLPAALSGGSTWPISFELARVLTALVRDLEPQSVLEFGCGLSSLVLARALAAGGGRLTSIDHEAGWCEQVWPAVERVEGVDAELVVSPLRWRVGRQGMHRAYREPRRALSERGPFDLVLIDGPQWWLGRETSLYLAHAHLRADALIVVDDAGRDGEQVTLARWLDAYPGLSLAGLHPSFPRQGLALLVHDGDRRMRWSAKAMLASTADTVLLGAHGFCRRRRWTPPQA